MKRYYLEVASFLVKDESVFPPDLTDMPGEAQIFTEEEKRGDVAASYGGQYREILVAKAVETLEGVTTENNLYEVIRERDGEYIIKRDDGTIQPFVKNYFTLIEGVEYDAFFEGRAAKPREEKVELNLDFPEDMFMKMLQGVIDIKHYEIIEKLSSHEYLIKTRQGSAILRATNRMSSEINDGWEIVGITDTRIKKDETLEKLLASVESQYKLAKEKGYTFQVEFDIKKNKGDQ